MAISESSREKLNWLILEAALIVASILLAFWIDAWWGRIQDEREEIEILAGLEIEFIGLIDGLDHWAQQNKQGMEQIEQVLSDSVHQMDLHSIESAFGSASISNVLGQRGAAESLFTSGRLEGIGNRDMRARLVKWPDLIEDIRTNDLAARNYAVNQIWPILAMHGFPRDVCQNRRIVCSEPDLEREPVPQEYIELAKDPEFRALLIYRRGWMRIAERDHEIARDEGIKILGMIKTRLASLET